MHLCLQQIRIFIFIRNKKKKQIKQRKAKIQIQHPHQWLSEICVPVYHYISMWSQLWDLFFHLDMYIFYLSFRPIRLVNRRSQSLFLPQQGQAQNRNNSEGSTWRNTWKKMRILLPFMWPKKSHLLQLSVFFCFVLLLAGRVANVFVPILYKLIGMFISCHMLFSFLCNFIFVFPL